MPAALNGSVSQTHARNTASWAVGPKKADKDAKRDISAVITRCRCRTTVHSRAVYRKAVASNDTLFMLTDVAYGATVCLVIKSFQHKGLKQFFTKGNKRGIASFNVERVKRILFAINAASSPLDLMIPGLDTHELGGNRKGTWAITLTRNHRITFAPEGTDMKDVNLEDYH